MNRIHEKPRTSTFPSGTDAPSWREAGCECEWTPVLAECLARVFGIGVLSESHWRVIGECREEQASHGRPPDLRTLAAHSAMSVPQLESLFPEGQAALAWILAGIVPPSTPSTPPAAGSDEAAPPAEGVPDLNVRPGRRPIPVPRSRRNHRRDK